MFHQLRLSHVGDVCGLSICDCTSGKNSVTRKVPSMTDAIIFLFRLFSILSSSKG